MYTYLYLYQCIDLIDIDVSVAIEVCCAQSQAVTFINQSGFRVKVTFLFLHFELLQSFVAEATFVLGTKMQSCFKNYINLFVLVNV